MAPDVTLQYTSWRSPKNMSPSDETDVFISVKLKSYLVSQWIIST